LTNSCKADQTAKDTCKKAQDAANAQPPKQGGQADAFNAAFGIKTNFAAVQVIDDQGRVVGGAASAAVGNNEAIATSAAAAPAATDAASSGSGIGNFGSCSVPQIEFGAGFDNRKETSFEPVDKSEPYIIHYLTSPSDIAL
jgi:hypothetical protein